MTPLACALWMSLCWKAPKVGEYRSGIWECRKGSAKVTARGKVPSASTEVWHFLKHSKVESTRDAHTHTYTHTHWPYWKHAAPNMRLAEVQCTHSMQCYPETHLRGIPQFGPKDVVVDSGHVRPRQGTEICNFGAPSPLEALHWVFLLFLQYLLQFSKTSPLKSG